MKVSVCTAVADHFLMLELQCLSLSNYVLLILRSLLSHFCQCHSQLQSLWNLRGLLHGRQVLPSLLPDGAGTFRPLPDGTNRRTTKGSVVIIGIISVGRRRTRAG